MKAKDTVMPDEQSEDLMSRNSAHPIKTQVRLVKEAQAEISFKAGEDKGYSNGFERGIEHCTSVVHPVILEEEHKAGIREVVEWLIASSPMLSAGADVFAESASHTMKQDISYYPVIKLVDWQAKLKEWEIN